ncbi:MAG: hypothetical protein OMM_10200, partial [Candidatus Magnetoglobus multicellularis str. Araruama]
NPLKAADERNVMNKYSLKSKRSLASNKHKKQVAQNTLNICSSKFLSNICFIIVIVSQTKIKNSMKFDSNKLKAKFKLETIK